MEASLSKRYIEGVQRRATKLISGLMGYTYEDRLNILKLTTLETRRLKCDLIEVFEMLKGFDNLYPFLFFLIKTLHLGLLEVTL